MTEPPKDPPHDGTTTLDLGIKYTGTAQALVPAREWHERPDAEQHIRTRGKWLIISGLTITILASVIALVWHAGHGHDMPLGVLLPLQALGLGGIALGALEYLGRPSRHMQRQCLERVDQLDAALTSLVGLMDEELQQRFYKGAAWLGRSMPADTGTEHARPLNEHRASLSGDVLRFRQRNDRT